MYSEESGTQCIPDTQSRIHASYTTVKKQLDLLSSYFSLIHDDLHGDLLLLRTNLNLLPSNTLHIAHKNRNHHNNHNHNTETLHSDDDCSSLSDMHQQLIVGVVGDEDEDEDGGDAKSDFDDDDDDAMLAPTSNLDNILNPRQTQSIQHIVAILQKFVQYNAILVEHIEQNRDKIDSMWVPNPNVRYAQTHKLNLDVESIVATMSVKDLISTKKYPCHTILFHDILGCANTKQFFTRIYFIVSIWYAFFHSLHLNEYQHDCDTAVQSTGKEHDDDQDHDDDEKDSTTLCNAYLTKLFAMTDFSFLTKPSSASSSSSSSSANAPSSTPTATTTTSTSSASRSRRSRKVKLSRQTSCHADTNANPANDAADSDCCSSSLSSSAAAVARSNCQWNSSDADVDGDGGDALSVHDDDDCASNSNSNSTTTKNDFLLKYLNAQNNYLQSIWDDGMALLEYSLHLLQQQEFRLSCRVAHRCLELFQKQQMEHEATRRQQQTQQNLHGLNQDLYDGDVDGNGDGVWPMSSMMMMTMVDPVTQQAAQIPGLWYIEMHLANCYHTWGQSNMALYHINRTLDQLGNYRVHVDTLAVQLNTRSKFRPLSTYLVASAQRTLATTSTSLVTGRTQQARKIHIAQSATSPVMTMQDDDDDDDEEEEDERSLPAPTILKRGKLQNHMNMLSVRSSALHSRKHSNLQLATALTQIQEMEGAMSDDFGANMEPNDGHDSDGHTMHTMDSSVDDLDVTVNLDDMSCGDGSDVNDMTASML